MSSVIRRESASTAPAFSFRDVESQAREIIARAKAHADKLVADAESRTRKIAENLKREAHEEGLREGRQAGLEQAKQEARQAAMQAAQAELARLTQALATALAEYERNKRSVIALAESGLIELAVAIARRVCKIRVESSSEPARANTRALLELVKHHDDVELHVHPAERELLDDVVTEFSRSAAELEHVTIRADPTVERGGCLLRTRDGTIDASITGQLDQIAAAILCGPAGGSHP